MLCGDIWIFAYIDLKHRPSIWEVSQTSVPEMAAENHDSLVNTVVTPIINHPVDSEWSVYSTSKHGDDCGMVYDCFTHVNCS